MTTSKPKQPKVTPAESVSVQTIQKCENRERDTPDNHLDSHLDNHLDSHPNSSIDTEPNNQASKRDEISEKEDDANEQQNLTNKIEDEDLDDFDPKQKDTIKTLAADHSYSQPKSYASILTEQFVDARHTFKRSDGSVLTSAFIAGLEIGISYIMLTAVLALLLSIMSPVYATAIASLLYPIGFIVVVVGQSLLYTEQTSLLSLPVVIGLETLAKLVRLWLIVIFGNLLGGCVFSASVVGLGLRMGWFEIEHIGYLSHHVLDYDWWILLISAVMAGWLMGLAAWLTTSARDTLSRIVLVALITACIGVLGLHHSIVGNIEIFSGLLYADINLIDYLKFLLLALVGNTVGGVVFVTVLKARALQYDIEQFKEEDLGRFNTDWAK